ncbi:unnamed protein product [Amoebophrya sp. A25]|nr:unnamed protein product [Amoebophrya sp. A25]|eukprot:GSA25T00007618001.1
MESEETANSRPRPMSGVSEHDDRKRSRDVAMNIEGERPAKAPKVIGASSSSSATAGGASSSTSSSYRPSKLTAALLKQAFPDKKGGALGSPAQLTEELDECRRTERLEESEEDEPSPPEENQNKDEDQKIKKRVAEQPAEDRLLPAEDDIDLAPPPADPDPQEVGQKGAPGKEIVAASPRQEEDDEEEEMEQSGSGEAEDWQWNGGLAEVSWKKNGKFYLLQTPRELEEAKEAGKTVSEPRYKLPASIYEKLYPYQRHAVAWMWESFRKRKGGIHADEMGLGKTVMISAFLAGLIESGLARHFLLVVPNTLFLSWTEEMKKWVCPYAPDGKQFYIRFLHGGSTKKERVESVRKIARCGGALVTSYGMAKTHLEILQSVGPPQEKDDKKKKRKKKTAIEDDDFDEEEEEEKNYQLLVQRKSWDCIICDEAHGLKDRRSKGSKAIRMMEGKCRLLLTGTPYTNNLAEIWSLADLAVPGILGNFQTFEQTFAGPIYAGSKKSAAAFEVVKKDKLSRQLKTILSNHFLRRNKSEVFAQERRLALPKKTDIILFCELSENQKKMYSAFLESDIVREAKRAKKSGIDAFKAISLLKKVCDHPLMCLPFQPYHRQMLQKWGMIAGGDGTVDTPEEREHEYGDDDAKGYDWRSLVDQIPEQASGAVELSCKLVLLNSLVSNLAKRKHRILIFSYSTRMLDLIQSAVLRPNKIKFLRIDGSTDLQDRDAKVNKFENDAQNKWQVMCLSTKVGGVGLTLVSADRVILVEPGWSPAIDQQAMDRAHRLGQTKDVVVYRVISHASIEDKMFRVQVFKQGLCKTALGRENQQRYFNTNDMKALFSKLEDETGSTLQLLNCENDSEKVEAQLVQDCGELADDNPFWKSSCLHGFADYSDLFQDYDEIDAAKEEVDAVEEQVLEAVTALKTETYQAKRDSLLPNKKDAAPLENGEDELRREMHVLEDGAVIDEEENAGDGTIKGDDTKGKEDASAASSCGKIKEVGKQEKKSGAATSGTQESDAVMMSVEDDAAGAVGGGGSSSSTSFSAAKLIEQKVEGKRKDGYHGGGTSSDISSSTHLREDSMKVAEAVGTGTASARCKKLETTSSSHHRKQAGQSPTRAAHQSQVKLADADEESDDEDLAFYNPEESRMMNDVVPLDSSAEGPGGVPDRSTESVMGSAGGHAAAENIAATPVVGSVRESELGTSRIDESGLFAQEDANMLGAGGTPDEDEEDINMLGASEVVDSPPLGP